MSLLQMSFSGGVMILAIIAVRAFTINRLPKKVFGMLWGAVLLRLLIPFSVPTMLSAYSLMNRNEPIQAALSDTPVEYLIPQAAAVQAGTDVGTAAVTAPHVLPASGWTLLWIAGAAVCAVYFVVSYLRGLLEFRTSLPVSNEFAVRFLSDHRLRREIRIRQSDRISAPLTYGILRPVILMPKKTDWEDKLELQYVLTHEFVHIRRLDMVWKLISALALCIHWFNPLVWAMYILFNRDIELSCDESVVRSYGERSKSLYARALLTMEEKKSGLMPLCNNFSKNAIEERITAIMKIKRITLWAVMTSAAVFIAVVVLFATTAEGKPLPDADDVQADAEGTEAYDIEDKISDEDLGLMAGGADAGGTENDMNVRPEKAILQYDLAGSMEEMPVTLYVGEGFSIYVPDETGWNVYDETLEPPYLMAAVYSSYVSIDVSRYTEESVEDVIEGLLSDGYTYDADTKKYQRFDGPLDELILEERRVYGQDNDVWVVDSRYLAEVEFGGRLDAIADTFAVTVSGEQGLLPAAAEKEASDKEDVAGELEGLMTMLCQAYFAGDVDTVRGLVVRDYIWSLDVYGDPDHADEVEVLQLKGPQAATVRNYPESYDMSLEFRIPGEDSLTYLTATWVKEDDAWRVEGYWLEK